MYPRLRDPAAWLSLVTGLLPRVHHLDIPVELQEAINFVNSSPPLSSSPLHSTHSVPATLLTAYIFRTDTYGEVTTEMAK